MDFENKLEEVFRILDKEGRSSIYLKDLAKGLRAAGLNPTEAQIEEYEKELSIADETFVAFEDFKKTAEKCKDSNLVTPEVVLNYFLSFDSNNEEALTLVDLKKALCESGDKLDDRDIDRLMRDFDIDNTGKVDIRKFVEGLFRV